MFSSGLAVLRLGGNYHDMTHPLTLTCCSRAAPFLDVSLGDTLATPVLAKGVVMSLAISTLAMVLAIGLGLLAIFLFRMAPQSTVAKPWHSAKSLRFAY